MNKIPLLLLIVILAAVTSSDSKAILKRESDKCRQSMAAGRCFGYIPSYAYDPITGKCKEFIYGGCGGNENRFDTIRECEKSCRGV